MHASPPPEEARGIPMHCTCTCIHAYSKCGTCKYSYVAQVCFQKTSGHILQSGSRHRLAFAQMLLTWPLRTKSQPKERRNTSLTIHGRSTLICPERLLARRDILSERLLARRRRERGVFCNM